MADTPDDAWRRDAQRLGNDAAHAFLLEWLYARYLRDRPEGAVAAFNELAGELRGIVAAREPLEFPQDRTEALASDRASDAILEFLFRVGSRLGA